MSSTNNSASDGNTDEPQPPAKKKIKASDVDCSAGSNDGNQRITVPPPSNSSFMVTSLSTVQSVTANMSRPSAPVCVIGSELQKSSPLYNRQMRSHLAPNQKQPCVQQMQPVQQHQQPVQQVQKQVAEDGNSQPTSNSDISSEGQAIDGGHGLSLMDSKDMEISFDNFPYYLSERTKYHLVASYFIHVNHKGHTSKPDIQHTKRRILLSGPEGSEIYQETLAVALTHHFGARLLVLDCSFNVNILSAFGQPLINDAWKFHLCHAPSKYLWGSKYGSRSMNMPKFSNAVSHLLASQPTLLYEKSQSQTLKIGDRVVFTGLNFGGVCSTIAPRGPTFGNRGTVLAVGNSNSNRVGVRFDVPIPEGSNLAGLCEAHHGFLVDGNEICIDLEDQVKPIFSPIKDLCADCRLILFVKHAGTCLVENFAAFQGIHSMVNKLPENVFVIGSHILKKNPRKKENFHLNKDKEPKLLDIRKMLLEIFQEEINIDMPEDPKLCDDLKHQLEQDAELLKVQENIALLHQVVIQHGLESEDVEMVDVKDQKITDENAEKVVKWAVGYELMARTPKYINSKLVLSRESILYGLNNLRDTQTDKKNSKAFPKEVATDNEYEKRLLAEVILHGEIGVKFDDIGALDSIKDTLKELVMLPLQRPELFFKGQLRKPCRGILLFGPSGTGKTMLAKAVATETGANFLNISAYSITSKWYGESEKYVKAIFSLASKIAPSVVFIDEVDSLLGMRRDLEHEVTRKVKNEFMMNWDGLRTKDKERVLVLAATNRPFDLDEAVIRRLPRRLMVNLPDAANRSKILKVILAKEDLSPNVDFDAIAHMTEGFSGSDLKNLCIAAAYQPVREILKKEKQNSQKLEEAKFPEFRPLDMEDFKYSCKQVRASLPTDSKIMEDLIRWNEHYGEGGSPRKRSLSYYI